MGGDAPPPSKSAARPPRPVLSANSPAAISSRDGTGGGSGEHVSGYRCSKCDFKVLRFDDLSWASDVDYMFFRNYMPNVGKLQHKLKVADSRCAFACQCTWVTADLGSPHGVSHWFASRS